MALLAYWSTKCILALAPCACPSLPPDRLSISWNAYDQAAWRGSALQEDGGRWCGDSDGRMWLKCCSAEKHASSV